MRTGIPTQKVWEMRTGIPIQKVWESEKKNSYTDDAGK